MFPEVAPISRRVQTMRERAILLQMPERVTVRILSDLKMILIQRQKMRRKLKVSRRKVTRRLKRMGHLKFRVF